MQILTFTLQDETFAIGIDLVETIENVANITPVPKSIPALIGLTSSRGAVIPVINTSLLVGREKDGTGLKKLIIANVKDEKLALAVDDIDDVIEIEESDIEYLNIDHNISIVKVGETIITLLNKNQLERI